MSEHLGEGNRQLARACVLQCQGVSAGRPAGGLLQLLPPNWKARHHGVHPAGRGQ
jgi:hypothetical protein